MQLIQECIVGVVILQVMLLYVIYRQNRNNKNLSKELILSKNSNKYYLDLFNKENEKVRNLNMRLHRKQETINQMTAIATMMESELKNHEGVPYTEVKLWLHEGAWYDEETLIMQGITPQEFIIVPFPKKWTIRSWRDLTATTETGVHTKYNIFRNQWESE